MEPGDKATQVQFVWELISYILFPHYLVLPALSQLQWIGMLICLQRDESISTSIFILCSQHWCITQGFTLLRFHLVGNHPTHQPITTQIHMILGRLGPTGFPSTNYRGSLHTSQISHLLLYPSLWLLIPGLSSQISPLFPTQPSWNVSSGSVISLRNGYNILYVWGTPELLISEWLLSDRQYILCITEMHNV